MKEIRNKQPVFEEPVLHIVHMTETDTITTSGDPDYEGEIIPFLKC